MEPRTLDYIAGTCGGKLLQGSGDASVHQIATDSRKVQRGDLFLALAGPRFDGHMYWKEAIERGAVALLLSAEKIPEPLPSAAIISTPDTRAALGQLAAAYRGDFDLPVLAVGGSNGKTTTKDLLASVLGQHGKILANEASFNNDIGVPLTLLNLTQQHQAAVLEVGTNHPGELAPLLRMIRPAMGVLTSIGREHLEFFGDLNGVVDEEGWLGELLPEDGVFFLNGDGPWKDPILRRVRARPVTVGLRPGNDWQATEIQIHSGGTRFLVRAPQRYFSGSYQIKLLGKHQVTNALLAIAVGAEFDLKRDQLQRGLAHCLSPQMRMQLVSLGGLFILDDSYNANADSMKAALETLQELPAAGRRIAVLGDMAELGAEAESAHREVGRKAAASGVEALIAVGRMAGVMAGAAREAGLKQVREFPDTEAALAALTNDFQTGDLVLVKASRSTGLDRMVQAWRRPVVAHLEI